MQITDMLANTGGLRSMALELGIDEKQAESGAGALIPAILGGLKKQVQSQPAGLAGLGGLLAQLGGSGLLDNVLSPQPTDVSQGNNVLGQIFGSKDVSRAVAQDAASQSGLEPSMLKKMLPIVAMLVAGYMAKGAAGSAGHEAQSGGGLGGLLSSLLGGKPSSEGAAASSGVASMLDLGGASNPLDDILRIASKSTNQQPPMNR
jgi:hypothetical protein